MTPSIKGSVFAIAVEQLNALVARGALGNAEVEAVLGGEWLRLVQAGHIAPSAWYPVALYDRILTLLMNTAGGGNPEYLIQQGREAAARLTSQGIYKQLDRQVVGEVDERFVRNLLTMSKAIYSFTVWELEELDADERRMVLRVSEAADYPDSLRWRNCGFLEEMIGHAAQAPCSVESTRAPWDTIRFRVQLRGTAPRR
jgi:hypothetical protein